MILIGNIHSSLNFKIKQIQPTSAIMWYYILEFVFVKCYDDVNFKTVNHQWRFHKTECYFEVRQIKSRCFVVMLMNTLSMAFIKFNYQVLACFQVLVLALTFLFHRAVKQIWWKYDEIGKFKTSANLCSLLYYDMLDTKWWTMKKWIVKWTTSCSTVCSVLTFHSQASFSYL